MRKETAWQNQGYPIRDIYIDEINRAYIDAGNFFVVLGSATGIETDREIIKHEVVRLIIPIEAAKKFAENMSEACNQLIGDVPIVVQENTGDTVVENNNIKELLGAPFPLIR